MTGKIVCSDLTADGIGDPTVLPDLLEQIDGPVELFLADGAYDGEPTNNTNRLRQSSLSSTRRLLTSDISSSARTF